MRWAHSSAPRSRFAWTIWYRCAFLLLLFDTVLLIG
jgi:hypothetical protein